MKRKTQPVNVKGGKFFLHYNKFLVFQLLIGGVRDQALMRSIGQLKLPMFSMHTTYQSIVVFFTVHTGSSQLTVTRVFSNSILNLNGTSRKGIQNKN
ncbi:hypothetical protein Pyn_20687 [Prunus yedoensis var. nudiflora]|uniref:Uncharacterized protein n=1 Tax=Prunus yedoensis var. nudiflora TaxID=2094558 RepID=A0A314UY44_PRUYE|nr:hypothetical protein Pyn_20687 [Prunus yedoensis var. nudiflora]